MAETYWASKPTDEIGNALKRKVDDYGQYLIDSGIMSELRDSYKAFYGDSQIKSTGSQGELDLMRVNHYASLIRSIHTMVTSQRPAWQPRATNTDVKSQSQTILATGLLDYYAREKRMERHTDMSTLAALFLREAWVCTTWDATGGETYSVDPTTQQPIAEGDIQYSLFKMNEVVRDFNREDGKHSWVITIEWVNKFDEAAKYQELADKIIGLTTDLDTQERFRLRNTRFNREEVDLIPRYTFYHEKTAALPNGRMVTFFNGDIVVFDGSLPYRRLPLRCCTAEEMLESAFGHSPAFDLLPIQKAIDMVFSTVLSNVKSFGVQNVMVPKGSDIGLTQLSGGLNLLEFDSKLGPPQPLNLLQVSADVFKFGEMLIQNGETISGVNAVARGNASPQLSGAAMALLQATALQFSSGVQKANTRIVEDVGTDTIHILSDFANTKRVAYIVGKHNRSYIKEFKGDDISDISRVTVDSANALTKTLAGRTEIANQLLQAGQIERPQQYITLIQTGQLEPMYENETTHLLLIRQENEDLGEGKTATALITDKHWLHIPEHMSVLDSPEARQDPNITHAALAHIQEHMNLWQTMPPAMAQLLHAPIPPPQGPPPPPGPQGPPPQGGPGIPKTQGPPAGPATEQAANNQPNMPNNPMTGKQFVPGQG